MSGVGGVPDCRGREARWGAGKGLFFEAIADGNAILQVSGWSFLLFGQRSGRKRPAPARVGVTTGQDCDESQHERHSAALDNLLIRPPRWAEDGASRLTQVDMSLPRHPTSEASQTQSHT